MTPIKREISEKFNLILISVPWKYKCAIKNGIGWTVGGRFSKVQLNDQVPSNLYGDWGMVKYLQKNLHIWSRNVLRNFRDWDTLSGPWSLNKAQVGFLVYIEAIGSFRLRYQPNFASLYFMTLMSSKKSNSLKVAQRFSNRTRKERKTHSALRGWIRHPAWSSCPRWPARWTGGRTGASRGRRTRTTKWSGCKLERSCRWRFSVNRPRISFVSSTTALSLTWQQQLWING